MDFRQAENYLEGLQEKMVKFDLKPMQELVEAAELDLKKLKVIHVAGTNGKGSTVAFISSILKEAGFRVGAYTSPHLVTITERIRINSKKISRKDFARIVFETKKISKKMKRKPSYFETVTAAAFKYFLEKKVDFVVAEVGMGGRLDATNVLNGTVNVITDISLEHTKTLGSTLQKIAKEKGAIIKKNSFTVAGKKNSGFETIRKIAQQKNSEIVSPNYYTNFRTLNLKKPFELKNAKISLLGEFQFENASLALGAIHCLQSVGFNISQKAARNGLRKTFWPARIQVVQKNPLIVLDSTHTHQGAKELNKVIKKLEFEKLLVVFSCLADKDFRKILGALSFDSLIITSVDYKRALAPQIVQKSFPGAVVEKNMVFALKRAKKLASKKDLILITGSIYGAGDAMKALRLRT